LRSNIVGETSLGRSDVALTLNMTFFVAVMSGTSDRRDPAAQERKKREKKVIGRDKTRRKRGLEQHANKRIYTRDC
jgi:hypothetical protein